jgi:hypothetical protein
MDDDDNKEKGNRTREYWGECLKGVSRMEEGRRVYLGMRNFGVCNIHEDSTMKPTQTV